MGLGDELMARFRMRGMDEYEKMLSKLNSSKTIRAVIGVTIYSGAGIVADAMKAEIEALPVIDHRIRGSERKKLTGITSVQKRGLIEGFGISKMEREGGYYCVKLGFDGYNDVETPNSGYQPNAMIARAVNSGTSFREKNPFVDRAVNKSKGEAEQAMKKKLEEQFEKIVKEK